MSSQQPSRDGTCQLTGKSGRFVRSHLIPRALTKPPPNGAAFAQIGYGRRPTRRRDSWYDLGLVVRAGEDILSDYDNWAIAELRRLKLVWHSWGPMQTLATLDHTNFADSPWGIRKVQFSDPLRMRMFLLSLLWRAAATSIDEFAEIDIATSAMRRLRNSVRDGIPPPPDFFPATLTQISTLGLMHNLGPIAQIKRVQPLSRGTASQEPIFRFYFDGLVVHFHRAPTMLTMDGIDPMLVGKSNGTVISTVTFENSWELMNHLNCIADSEHAYPGGIARAEGGD